MPVRDLLNAASGIGAADDPNFNYVSLLLNGDGTNGAQNNTFLDSSTNNFTITRNGNTTQGSFSPYGSLWSNFFNRSTSDYLTVPNSTNWNIGGSSTFSVETWVYISTSGVQTALVGTENRWWLGYNFTDVSASANKFAFSVFTGSSWQNVNSTTTPVVGTWYHVAATFSSGTAKIYINGTEEASSTGFTVNTGTNVLSFGALFTASYGYGLGGYLSNLRIINGGTLVYTANFTPSTTPLTATANTVLLTCQSNRFIDNSSNNATITRGGSPSVQRFSPFNPTAPYSTSVIGGSGYFDGSDYLSVPTNSTFNQPGNFTTEYWAYFPNNTNYREVVSKGESYITIQHSSDSNAMIRIVAYGTATIATGGNVVPNQWNHFALVRNGSTVTAYLNGVSACSGTYSNSNSDGDSLIIGAQGYGGFSHYVTGSVADIRLTNSAVYTTTFTPPTAPLTAITNTSLLTNFTNAGIPDLAMQNNLETVGNAQVSTSVKKYGTGSLAFDGTGDWLSIPNTPNLQLGSGNFTIECWINFSSLASNRGIMYFGTNPNSNFSYGLQWASNALYFWYTTTGSNLASVSASWTPSTSVWYFLAVTRSGNDLKFFIDGTQIGTTQSLSGVTIFNSTDVILIGGEATGSPNSLPGTMNGYIDDMRITKGLARYTANFTPPTAALPTF